MKAIIQTKYGPPDILKLKEVRNPTPGDNEVLVKNYASSVNYGNLILVSGKPLISRLWSGFLKPNYTIPGSDISGKVEAVGKNITMFKSGDEVYGDLSSSGFGAYAEFVCAPENMLSRKPANLTFEEAAAVPQAALVALQGLFNKGKIKPGHKVMIYGASGGNGTFAVQIARSFGAEVTAVCSTGNLEMARSLGADHVIDYKKEDFLKSGRQYDLILGMAGFRSIFDYRRALKDEGIYVSVGGSMIQVTQGMMLGPLISGKQKKLTFLYQKPSQKDLIFIKEIIEAGHVKPVIDRVYPLSETAEALRYYGEGHSHGKVIIKIEHENK